MVPDVKCGFMILSLRMGSKLLISNVLICFDAWHMTHIDHLLGHHQICGSFGTLVWDQVLLNRYPFYPICLKREQR